MQQLFGRSCSLPCPATNPHPRSPRRHTPRPSGRGLPLADPDFIRTKYGQAQRDGGECHRRSRQNTDKVRKPATRPGLALDASPRSKPRKGRYGLRPTQYMAGLAAPTAPAESASASADRVSTEVGTPRRVGWSGPAHRSSLTTLGLVPLPAVPVQTRHPCPSRWSGNYPHSVGPRKDSHHRTRRDAHLAQRQPKSLRHINPLEMSASGRRGLNARQTFCRQSAPKPASRLITRVSQPTHHFLDLEDLWDRSLVGTHAVAKRTEQQKPVVKR